MFLRTKRDLTQPPAEQLITYERLVQLIEEWSKREEVAIFTPGTAHSGRKIFLVAVSSPQKLNEFFQYQREIRGSFKNLVNYPSLANPEIGKINVSALSKSTKPALLLHCGSFGFEASHTEAACTLIDHLITSKDKEVSEIMENSVVLVMPMVNPDSRELALEQWRNYPLAPGWPGMGNSYGFLMNRDFYFLSQPEVQAVHKVINEWRPLMALDTHEDMGFLIAQREEACWVPPFRRPRHKYLESAITDLVDEFSFEIANRWKQHNFRVWNDRQGAFISYLALDGRCDLHLDLHGIPCLFTESARTPGGQTWEDRNQQKLLAALTFLHKASMEYERILRIEYDNWEKQIYLGSKDEPKAFLLPKNPDRVRDINTTNKLISILLEHEIKVYTVNDPYPAYLVPLGQPDRPLILSLLQVEPWNLLSLPPAMGVECVKFESLNEKDRKICLESPLHPVQEVKQPTMKPFMPSHLSRANVLLLHNTESSIQVVNEALKLGQKVYWLSQHAKMSPKKNRQVTFCIVDPLGLAERFAEEHEARFARSRRLPQGKKIQLTMPRIAVYGGQGANEKQFPSTGEILWALDNLGFPYAQLTEHDIRSATISHFDVLIVPAGSAPEMLNGWNRQDQNYSEPWQMPGKPRGLEQKGISQIIKFIENGGRYIGIGSGGGSLACKELGGFADVNIVDQGLGQARVYLAIKNQKHPLFSGLGYFRDQEGRLSQKLPAFYYCDLLWPQMDSYAGPIFKAGSKAKILATFNGIDYEPWTEHLAREPLSFDQDYGAIVYQSRKRGSIVLIGINLGFRGQWISTYPLLANSVYSWNIR